ncbi:MAG: NUDIX domain-containing protein [Gordonia sp. (in: high G+C Gram-positive bacteria)]
MSVLENGRTILVSAVVLRDHRGAVLTVRKRNTDRFMFPGGKPEVGETAEAAAIREVAEELAVELDPARLQLVGVFTAEAANEPGCKVQATVFEHPPVSISGTAAEIDEMRWQALGERPYPDDLAPLLADHVFPTLAGKQHRAQ